ncbi:glucose-1-phosphate adenylyltransferase [Heyndrickxia ginsengihumi]|uniref:Glucose-1-phosphate adenylyltransferase n=1 Tax=Heyndrickxia ginsengihumi TaxID=363870 RepID=A0A0A6VA11_9BACI|nr:glucose-1-phosphate adenylyltransferase [Heyndrickxia ginsengihumi]KHD84353.1 glucose-1-phosphate adenylyltransferase [Heyndrickxia ginsengihumi]MBE6185255.1 glucose-1-phosphate adenylyltransferase [Bacillus sp. (in: firmicutes)]MCM3023424.1 glucose-1-phosphate adenylyltransferase [Heyndrickxia ginsengihumi]
MAEKKWIAMLLAGGQGTRLGNLTSSIAKPALTFGGKYRIIDFSLSNCTHSGIDTVGVLTQYQPHLLNSYVGNGRAWDLDRKFGGAMVLPPYIGKNGGEWYRGTANAVYQNIHYIDHYDPEYVVILSGDHIYKMDYEKLLQFHIEKGSQATISVIEVPWQEANRFGIITTNDNGKIVEFEEKPPLPRSNLASMGVYLFNWKFLKQYLIEDEQNAASSNDFGKDIIPKMLADSNQLYAYQFNGYWKDVGTINSFWESHMDLLNDHQGLRLDDPHWKIYAGDADHPPQYISPEAEVRNSLINEGCWIYGKVASSVVSYNVYVGKDTNIKDSVIMPNVTIGNNVTIERAIIASNTIIEDGKVIAPLNQTDDIQLICQNHLIQSAMKEVL